MKFRSDFVTNSSSSSFILGFNSEDKREMQIELARYLMDDEMEYYAEISEELDNAKIMTPDEAIDYIKEEYKWRSGWYGDQNNWYEDQMQTEQGACEQATRYKTLALLQFGNEHGNDYDGEIEHYIAPGFPNLVTYFNNH